MVGIGSLLFRNFPGWMKRSCGRGFYMLLV